MKNQILDEPIRNSFSDFLEKGETILWEGQSEIKKDFHPPWPEERAIHYFIFYKIILPLYLNIIHIGKNKKTGYAVTSKRVLFRLGHWKKNRIHDILFSQIKNLLIIEDEKNAIGSIFLIIKNPAAVNFDTFEIINHSKSEKRHQPTLENLKNPNKVAELIRQGIKNPNN
jgi:hypothetical protein